MVGSGAGSRTPNLVLTDRYTRFRNRAANSLNAADTAHEKGQEDERPSPRVLCNVCCARLQTVATRANRTFERSQLDVRPIALVITSAAQTCLLVGDGRAQDPRWKPGFRRRSGWHRSSDGLGNR